MKTNFSTLTRTLIATLAVLGLTLAGCGSEGDDGDGDTGMQADTGQQQDTSQAPDTSEGPGDTGSVEDTGGSGDTGESGDTAGGDAGAEDAGGETSDWTNVRESATENDTFFVTYAPDPDPIPLNELFTMEVSVYESSAMDTMVSNASITVDATMPTHGHGMNTDPKVTDNGDGTFKVEGMKFHMPGSLDAKWVMTIEVEQGQQTDTAKFEIIIQDQ